MINNVGKNKKANNCQTQIKEIARDAILRTFLPDLYVKNKEQYNEYSVLVPQRRRFLKTKAKKFKKMQICSFALSHQRLFPHVYI